MDDDYFLDEYWDEFNESDIDDVLEHIRTGRKVPKVAPYYRSYTDIRDSDVAKAALEALENGITLTELIASNKTVKTWWSQHLKTRKAEQDRAEKEKIRRKAAAERKKIEDAKRAEAIAKLTPEERVAFGLNAKGYHK